MARRRRHRRPTPRPHASHRPGPSQSPASTVTGRRDLAATPTLGPVGRLDAVGWLVIALLVVAAGFFLLGKYLELGSPDPFDSAAYVYSAKHLLAGARLGIDEKSSARPATLLVNTIGVALFGFSETGPKLIQGVFQATALVFMFMAMRRLFGRTAAAIGVCVAAYYLSAPLIAKYGNTKEQYLIALAVIAASALIFYETTGRRAWAIAAGAATVNAYYFKETGIAIAVALAAYLLVGRLAGWFDRSRFRHTVTLLVVGAAVGLVPLAAFYVWQRQSRDFLQTLPAAAVQIAGLIVAMVWGLPWLWNPAGPVRRHLAHVRRSVRIAGLTAIVGTLIACCGLIAIYSTHAEGNPSHAGSDVVSYLTRDLPGATTVMGTYYRLKVAARRVVWILTSPNHYVHRSRAAMSFAKQAPIVFRYYSALAVPMLLGTGAIATAVITAVRRRRHHAPARLADRMVVLLATWWILDVLLVWVSPRSYEQYYLPLTASGAVLGGCAIAAYLRRLRTATTKGPWILGGSAMSIMAVVLAWPIFFGFTRSRFSGQPYGQDQRRNGYVQRLQEVRMRARSPLPWETIGDTIRQRTNRDDTIYVWGWYPGIYVRAQRFSCIPQAFFSDMHVMAPDRLASYVRWQLVEPMRRNGLPAFIVDSRKQHFPWDRPPLELWPMGAQGPIKPGELATYEKVYRGMLAERIDEDEAARFDAMGLLRRFVMTHYDIVPDRRFGTHLVLARRQTPRSDVPPDPANPSNPSNPSRSTAP